MPARLMVATRVRPNEHDFDEICAKAGLHYSRAIHAVLKALAEAKAPITTYDVHRFAQEQGYQLALPTAYRLLKALVSSSVVIRHALNDGFARYSLRADSHEGLLIDTADGGVAPFVDDALTARLEEIAKELGYRLVRYRLVLYGQAKKRPGRPKPSARRVSHEITSPVR